MNYLSLSLRRLLKLVWGYVGVLREDWPEFGYIFRIPTSVRNSSAASFIPPPLPPQRTGFWACWELPRCVGWWQGCDCRGALVLISWEPPQLCRNVLNCYHWVRLQRMNFLDQALYSSCIVVPLWMGNNICKAVNLAALNGWPWKWKMDLKTIQAMSCLGDVEACVMGM